MAISASALRQDIYRLLDQVIETGKPLEINRRGKTLRLTTKPGAGKLANLVPHESIQGDPESLVHCDWSAEWNGVDSLESPARGEGNRI